MIDLMSRTQETEPTALAGAARTRQAIADAARSLFATHEYADASVRTIAAEAGVDPALVIRYFSSKENLFLETVEFTGLFERAMAGPLDGLGERLLNSLLGDEHDANFSAYRAMMRASGSNQVRERLLDAIGQMFVAPLAPRLSGPDAELRARLVAAQIAGLIDAIAILGDEVVNATARERLAAVYGVALQSLIDLES